MGKITQHSSWEKGWGDRRDSNPQQPEPQSGALPLSYGHQPGLETSLGDARGQDALCCPCPFKAIFRSKKIFRAELIGGDCHQGTGERSRTAF